MSKAKSHANDLLKLQDTFLSSFYLACKNDCLFTFSTNLHLLHVALFEAQYSVRNFNGPSSSVLSVLLGFLAMESGSQREQKVKLQDTFCMPILLSIQKWLPLCLLNESACVAFCYLPKIGSKFFNKCVAYGCLIRHFRLKNYLSVICGPEQC